MRRVLCLGLLFCLALSQGAQAEYDPIRAGTAKLTLDPSFAAFLKKDGVTLTGAQGAKRAGSSFALPVSSGQLDPTTAKGEIDQTGTLVFQSERKKVPLRDITVKTQHAPLLAKVGGSQLKLATSPSLSFQREGFESTFAAKKLKLSSKVATRLNKKLRPRVPFKGGALLGALKSTTQPLTTTITEANRATLLFDPSFVSKLESRFVSLNPIFPAEHVGATFTFPIVKGGQLAPDGSQGTLRSGGTVELLQLGGGQVFWTEPWLDLGAKQDSAEVDLEPTPAFPGKLGRVAVFDAAPGSVSSDPQSRTISDSGVSLTLTAQTAKALDDSFDEGKALFGAGEVVGAFSFTAQGQ